MSAAKSALPFFLIIKARTHPCQVFSFLQIFLIDALTWGLSDCWKKIKNLQ